MFDYDERGNQRVIGGTTISLGYDGENRQPLRGGNALRSRWSRREPRVDRARRAHYRTKSLAAEYGNPNTTADCTTCYLTTDPLGSTRLITNEVGDVEARYDYLPFGQEILPPPSGGRADVQGYGQSDAVRHKFTGNERDVATRLGCFAVATS